MSVYSVALRGWGTEGGGGEGGGKTCICGPNEGGQYLTLQGSLTCIPILLEDFDVIFVVSNRQIMRQTITLQA